MAFAVTSGGWLWTRTRKQRWAKALRGVLLPLMTGFGVDSLLLLAMAVFKPGADATSAKARAFEECLLHLRICLEHASRLRWPWWLGIIAVLAAFTWFFPQWKVGPRFSLFQQCLGGLVIALAAMTTFTVFSDQPLQRRAQENQAALIRRYEIALRKEWDGVAKEVVAKAVTASPAPDSASEKQRFKLFIQSLAQVADRASQWPAKTGEVPLSGRYRFQYVDFPQVVAETIAKHYTQEALDQSRVHDLLSQVLDSHAKTDAPLPEEKTLLTIPKTVDQLRAQRGVVEQQESRAQNAESQAEQAKEVANLGIAEFIGLPVPEFGGLVGAYVSIVIDMMADVLAGPIQNWSRSIGPHVEAWEAFQRLKESTGDAVATMRKLLLPQRWASRPEADLIKEDVSRAVATEMLREMEEVGRREVPDE
jgi:hypothetical protein